MSKPLLDYSLVHETEASPSFLACDGFRFGGHDYLSAQASAWESSEISWDQGDPAWGTGKQIDLERGFGRWHGPGALMVRPGNLWIVGATLERLGHDDVARVTAGTPLPVSWDYFNPGFIEASGGAWRVCLQDAVTGALLLNTTTESGSAIRITLPALTGHAFLWVRLENALRQWQMPPDYQTVRGYALDNVPLRFQYEEDGQDYIWDYEADVGRRPGEHSTTALTGEVLWDEYLALVQSGGLLHLGAWSQYISDGSYEIQGGPWSALRIAVGATPFVAGSSVLPQPGPALYQVNAGVRTAYAFDALACSITAFEVMRTGSNAGQARIGGTIATRSGPTTAFWHFYPGTGGNATLLGTAPITDEHWCEASLYPTIADILEEPDSTELELTYSHLHRYDPTQDDVAEALPGLPRATLGHPGGRCLRQVDGTVKFFTEFFGGVGAPVGSDAFAQFYNTLRTVDPRETASSGKGTVFHGHNAAEVCWGKFYGWVQDKAFADPTAQQFFGFLQDGVWVASSMAPFPASEYHWQRVRRVGTSDGLRVLVAGKSATSEAALWGVSDGAELREASLPFRPRRLTRVTLADGSERLYCTGRFVSKNEDGEWLCSLSHALIVLTGGYKTVRLGWNDDEQGFCMALDAAEAAGLIPAHMAGFLWWQADETQPAGGYWLPRGVAPTDGRPYLQLNINAEANELCYLLHNGPLPYDPNLWPFLDLIVYDDGGIGTDAISPVPGATNAQQALDLMPPGSKYGVVFKDIPPSLEWDSLQVSDVNPRGSGGHVPVLWAQGVLYPNLWVRADSTAPANDLTTYTQRLNWSREQSLSKSSMVRVEVCVLVAPDAFTDGQTIFAPTIDPCTVNQLPPVIDPTAGLEVVATEGGDLLSTEGDELLLLES